MKRMNKLMVLSAALFVAAMPFRPAAAAVNCDFKNGLDELSKAQAALSAKDTRENITRELAARKNLINQSIDCSISEANSVLSDVKLAETKDSDLGTAQNRIISRLGEIIDYYRTQKIKVNDLGIEGSKNFSADIKSWRNSNYVPALEISRNFIIFAKNQYMTQTAQNRLDQITLTLKALDLTGNQQIAAGLDKAHRDINSANEENEQAKNAFMTMAWPNDISDLMNSSLQHLKDAYQDFFDISKEAQSIVSAK